MDDGCAIHNNNSFNTSNVSLLRVQTNLNNEFWRVNEDRIEWDGDIFKITTTTSQPKNILIYFIIIQVFRPTPLLPR